MRISFLGFIDSGRRKNFFRVKSVEWKVVTGVDVLSCRRVA